MKEQAIKWPQEGVPDSATHRRSGRHGTCVQVDGAEFADGNLTVGSLPFRRNPPYWWIQLER